MCDVMEMEDGNGEPLVQRRCSIWVCEMMEMEGYGDGVLGYVACSMSEIEDYGCKGDGVLGRVT